MFEVHVSKHSLFRLKITVGCLTSTYPIVHVETPSRSRSVVWCVLCVHVACVVCVWCVWCVGCVCTCGVVCGVWVVGCVWVVCVHVVLCCVVVVCVWCVMGLGALSLLFSLLPLLFPFLFLSSFSFYLAPSLTLALAAFECDLVQSKCTAIGSLPPPLPHPFSPSPPQKRGTFSLQEYFRRGIYFLLHF